MNVYIVRSQIAGGEIWGVYADRATAQQDADEAARPLVVHDPGPEGSVGDVSWIIDARQRGTLPLLIVQGVLMTELAKAADFVLPGALGGLNEVEKAVETNGRAPKGREVVGAHSQILQRAKWVRAAPDTTGARLTSLTRLRHRGRHLSAAGKK